MKHIVHIVYRYDKTLNAIACSILLCHVKFDYQESRKYLAKLVS